MTNATRVNRVCEYAIRENVLPDLRFYPHYSEPGYDEPSGAILSANWNDRSRWNSASGSMVVTDERPSRIGRILERLGCELEWCDEWAACDSCYGAIRTEPDSMCWEPSYEWVDEGTILCAACAAEDDGFDS